MAKLSPQKIHKVNNLIIALSGPYGAGSSSLGEELLRIFNDWPGCVIKTIQVSELIKENYPFIVGSQLFSDNKKTHKRRRELQTAGTKIRQVDPCLTAKLVVDDIYYQGIKAETDPNFSNVDTLVFIVDSLKNKKEVEHLRKYYSKEFYMVFLHADRETRWRRMVDYNSWKEKDRAIFEELDAIDQDEKNINKSIKKGTGQQVSELSSLADYYIVNDTNREDLREDGRRLVEILFGGTMNQPTFHEKSMHMAFSASNRSFCLSRQVGAAIIDIEGNLLGVGHNDVPKAYGGLYPSEDGKDRRCYAIGDRRCINDTNKEERYENLADKILEQVKTNRKFQNRLKKIKINKTAFEEVGIDKALKEIILDTIDDSQLREATEYCRAVHAEMEAILSVSRSHTGSTKDAILYVTTEPCHNCTKHIISAGIKKVIFIEPYPKSLGYEFHSDAIVLGSGNNDPDGRKVLFLPYRGIAPQRFHDFFTLEGARKDKKGKYIRRSKTEQSIQPKFAAHLNKRSRSDSPLDAISAFESQTANEIGKKVHNKKPFIKIKGRKNG